ncbi:MAG: DnaB-like helicase C-terminal domain-containing protein [Gemmatales bacterium]
MSEQINPYVLSQPPHDTDAEKELLSCMLRDNRVIDEVRGLICHSDFFDRRNVVIAECINALASRQAGSGVDFITLKDELATRHLEQECGGWGYLAELVSTSLHSAHALHYAQIVRQKSIQRQVIHKLQSMFREAFNPAEPDTFLDWCEQQILQIRDLHANAETKPLIQALHTLLDRADQQYRGGIERRYTGFHELDGMVKLSAGQLIIIAARTAVGKSLLGIQLAKQISNLASGRKAVFIASMEMDSTEIASRLIAAFGSVPTDVACVERLLNRIESKQLHDAVVQLESCPLFINDSGTQTVNSIAAEARRLNRKHGLGLIVVDYLQLVDCQSNRNKSRAELLGEVSSGLKRLAKELQCPVIALCQLNRETSDHEEPELRHIRESGSIEQDADMVWLLWREATNSTDPNLDQTVYLKVAKNRQGPTGTIKLLHRKEFMRFDEEQFFSQTFVES